MPAPIKFNQDEINKIINLYNSGLTSHNIGKLFNLSCQPILRILHKNNVKLKNYYDDVNEEDVIIDYKNKMTIKEISIKYNRGDKVIHDILKSNNIDINRKYKCNFDYFNNIDNSEKAYWLGFLYADAGMDKYSMNLSIDIKDINHLHKFNEDLNSDMIIRFIKNMCILKISNKQFVDNLIKNGCVPKKSLIIRYPNIDKKFNRDFIRGYFDGDGCISIRKSNNKNGTFDISSGSINFLNEIKTILIDELNISNNKIYMSKKKKYGSIEWSKKDDLIKLFNYLYTNSPYLDRKKEKFQLLLNNNSLD
jgi:intein-encoded DNA endonuclease-like protein